MKALGYNPHDTIKIALAGNAADLIKHHDRAAQRGEQLLCKFIISLFYNLLVVTTPMGRLRLSGKGARCPLLKPQAKGTTSLWKPR